MGAVVTTMVGVAEAEEVCSLAFMKQAGVVDADLTADDEFLQTAVVAAREMCEQELGRSIGRQTLRLTLDAFPSNGEPIKLMRPPVVEIVSVSYRDTTGAARTLESSGYTLDSASRYGAHWLLPAFDADWPQTLAGAANAVTITYLAGYSPTDVPRAVRMWIAVQAATMNRFRELATEKPVSAVGFYARLLDQFRVAEERVL